MQTPIEQASVLVVLYCLLFYAKIGNYLLQICWIGIFLLYFHSSGFSLWWCKQCIPAPSFDLLLQQCSQKFMRLKWWCLTVFEVGKPECRTFWFPRLDFQTFLFCFSPETEMFWLDDTVSINLGLFYRFNVKNCLRIWRHLEEFK